MIRLPVLLPMLALALTLATGPLAAETPPAAAPAPAASAPVAPATPAVSPEPEADHQLPWVPFAMVRFGLDYTASVVLGVVAGGILMNGAVGGLPATLAGAAAGSLAGSWWFFERFAPVLSRPRVAGPAP